MAKIAGRTPRRMRTSHHAAASPASAFGSTAKNFHSLLAVRRRIIVALSRTSSTFLRAVELGSPARRHLATLPQAGSTGVVRFHPRPETTPRGTHETHLEIDLSGRRHRPVVNGRFGPE